MRYFKTLTAAGVALALAGGTMLAPSESPTPPQVVETAGNVAAATVADDTDSHRAGPSADDEQHVQTPTRPSASNGRTYRSDGHVGDATTDDDVAFGPVHEVIAASDHDGPPSGADPSEPIGGVNGNGSVPEGIGYTTFPGNAPAKTPHAGPGSYSVGPGCHVQCISSGVAYPRGLGAELVVKTTVDADIFISVIADTNGDGDYDFSEFAWSNGKVDDFRWTLDHLDPGQKYYAMAAATDENDKTAHAFGEFTTLSQRDIYVSLGDVSVSGGPDNVSSTSLRMKVNGHWSIFTPGNAGIPLYKDVDRLLDLDLLVTRYWDDDLCEAWQLYEDAPSHGHWSDACLAYHHVPVDDIDVDTKPAGKTRWTETVVHTSIVTPGGGGGALPPGYGDPYYFSFSAPVSVYVTYS